MVVSATPRDLPSHLHLFAITLATKALQHPSTCTGKPKKKYIVKIVRGIFSLRLIASCYRNRVNLRSYGPAVRLYFYHLYISSHSFASSHLFFFQLSLPSSVVFVIQNYKRNQLRKKGISLLEKQGESSGTFASASWGWREQRKCRNQFPSIILKKLRNPSRMTCRSHFIRKNYLK